MSSGNWLRFVRPLGVMADHHVENGQQFPHAGSQRNFVRFMVSYQPSEKFLNDGVPTDRVKGRHVENPPHVRAAPKDMARTKFGTTIIIKRGDAHQLANCLATKLAQLGQVSNQGTGNYGANTR